MLDDDVWQPGAPCHFLPVTRVMWELGRQLASNHELVRQLKVHAQRKMRCSSSWEVSLGTGKSRMWDAAAKSHV